MDPKLKFDLSLDLTRIILFCSGIQISDSIQIQNHKLNHFINHWLFYLSQIWLYTDIVGEILNIIDSIHGEKSFDEISLMIPCITVSILGTVKAAPLFLQRNVLINILNELREIHPDTPDDEEAEITEEQKIAKDAMTHFNISIRLYLLVATLVLFPFCFLPLALMVYDRCTLGETDVKIPFPVKYFFDSTKPAVWPFVYFHQVVSTLVVNNNILGVDTLFYGICTFIRMHFRILQCRLQQLVPQKNSGPRTVTKMELTELVRRHQLLIELVKQMEKLFAHATLFNFITSSFLICLSVFNVTSILEVRAISQFMGFLCMSLFQILICCYGGDIIMQSSKEVSMAAYNSLWYLADPDIKRSLLLIHFRAQRPCKLTAANFADLNLSAFATVLRRSWSYLAMLKTVYQ